MTCKYRCMTCGDEAETPTMAEAARLAITHQNRTGDERVSELGNVIRYPHSVEIVTL